ncbi:hypothetical protein I4U23_010608 [Adineta vaga]|nr:hypothetical protein I4U23_010608 [Adineta vaga]
MIILIFVNVLIIPFTWFLLRFIFKPKSLENKSETNEHDEHSILVVADNSEEKSKGNIRDIYEGECAGDYSTKWTLTYDLVFLIIMICFLIILCTLTTIYTPIIWSDWKFWLKEFISFILIIIGVFCGGLICRHYCEIDDNGYILTNRSSHFKVNYTKKFQHLFVHLVPLVISRTKKHDLTANSLIYLCWSYYVMLLSNLILIKPLRERSKFLMIQFNSIDRPEDRPNTLLWVTLCNMISSNIITVFYRWLYQVAGLNYYLIFIFSLVNTVGDGLAEPIGVYFGKHRYKTRGCCNRTRYERSFEGSSCVFISTVFFILIFSFAFRTDSQLWITLLILPISMTIAEATSPHTCDSPFLQGTGGLIIFLIVYFI